MNSALLRISVDIILLVVTIFTEDVTARTINRDHTVMKRQTPAFPSTIKHDVHGHPVRIVDHSEHRNVSSHHNRYTKPSSGSASSMTTIKLLTPLPLRGTTKHLDRNHSSTLSHEHHSHNHSHHHHHHHDQKLEKPKDTDHDRHNQEKVNDRDHRHLHHDHKQETHSDRDRNHHHHDPKQETHTDREHNHHKEIHSDRNHSHHHHDHKLEMHSDRNHSHHHHDQKQEILNDRDHNHHHHEHKQEKPHEHKQEKPHDRKAEKLHDHKQDKLHDRDHNLHHHNHTELDHNHHHHPHHHHHHSESSRIHNATARSSLMKTAKATSAMKTTPTSSTSTHTNGTLLTMRKTQSVKSKKGTSRTSVSSSLKSKGKNSTASSTLSSGGSKVSPSAVDKKPADGVSNTTTQSSVSTLVLPHSVSSPRIAQSEEDTSSNTTSAGEINATTIYTFVNKGESKANITQRKITTKFKFAGKKNHSRSVQAGMRHSTHHPSSNETLSSSTANVTTHFSPPQKGNESNFSTTLDGLRQDENVTTSTSVENSEGVLDQIQQNATNDTFAQELENVNDVSSNVTATGDGNFTTSAEYEWTSTDVTSKGRRRKSRTRTTYDDYDESTTADQTDDDNTQQTTQDDWNANNNFGAGGGYGNDYGYSDNFQQFGNNVDYDSTTQADNDDTSVSNWDDAGGASTQSNVGGGNTGDYDDAYGTNNAYDDGGNGNTYDDYTDDTSDRTDTDDGYDTSTRSYSSDYNTGYRTPAQNAYNGYTSNYNYGNDLTARKSYGSTSKTKDPFDDDDDDDDDYDDTSTTQSTSTTRGYVSSYPRMNTWPSSDYGYSSSTSPTTVDDDKDTSSGSATRSAVNKSTDISRTAWTASTPSSKKWKKRWQGYTDTIGTITITTPYTGPSTIRRETIIHETVTRFMPGGVKYRYSKIHWDDRNCDIFNPWSRPPDLSTLFDYYKFRKVYYSKTRTFWEDVKHYLVKFVRIFKKDFRKGKRDG